MNLDTTLEKNRFNMVEQQIRTWDVLDLSILELLYKIKREEFVPPAYRNLAFFDMEIPLGEDAVMLSPKLEARILQEIQLKKTDKVLEIGTGSGYQTALLAEKSDHVISVEISSDLLAMAEKNLQSINCTNVTLEQGDGARGWFKDEPYDVIVLTASVPVLPDAFQHGLNPGGRLFAIVGENPVMEARLVTCKKLGTYESTRLFETSTAPLKNARQPERFLFND